MSATDNKQVIRRFYDECWNPGNTALIDTFKCDTAGEVRNGRKYHR